jgi:hypothetical protein
MIPIQRLAAFAIAIAAILLSPSNQSVAASTTESSPDQLVGKTYRLERAYLVSVHVPSDSVDKVLQALAAAVGLEYGKYDQVAYIDAEGMEQFRPLAGSKAGVQKTVTTTPSRVVTVSVVHDGAVLQKAVDAITRVHPYQCGREESESLVESKAQLTAGGRWQGATCRRLNRPEADCRDGLQRVNSGLTWP